MRPEPGKNNRYLDREMQIGPTLQPLIEKIPGKIRRSQTRYSWKVRLTLECPESYIAETSSSPGKYLFFDFLSPFFRQIVSVFPVKFPLGNIFKCLQIELLWLVSVQKGLRNEYKHFL